MTTLSRAAQSFQRHWRAEHRAEQTMKTYGAAIKNLVTIVGDKDVKHLTRDDIRDFLTVRATAVSLTTVSIEHRALRVFVKFLTTEGDICDRAAHPHCVARGHKE